MSAPDGHPRPYTFAGGGVSSSGGGGPGARIPSVSGLDPDSGQAAGGTRVAITGSGFTGATAVDFGTAPARSFSVTSDAQILAVSPAGSPGGTVDVTVTTPGGVSAAVSADRFSYQVPTGQGVTASPFADVPPTYWAFGPIGTLAGRGILNGFPDGTFRPEAAVTRAQFAKMLDLTLALQPSGLPTPFTDVPARAWYAPYVAAALRAGIVRGTSPTAFAPDQPLSREAMAAMVARALHLSGTAALAFTDAQRIDAWALPGVRAMVATRDMRGFPDGSFRPLAAASRAQAAQVLALMLQHLGGAGG